MGLIKIVIDQHLALPLGDFLSPNVLLFVTGRFRHYLIDLGFAKESVEAVLCRPLSSLSKTFVLLQELEAFRMLTEFGAFLEMYNRVYKIVEGIAIDKEVEPALFVDEAEGILLASLRNLSTFDDLMKLQQPVRRFFDQVKVMTEDASVRTNRLALLTEVKKVLDRSVDFSKLR